MTSIRRRIKQTTTLQDRLAIFAREVRDRASTLPPGNERQQLLKKARQADSASHMDDAMRSQRRTPK